MPSSSIARRRTNWLGTITASALRAEPSCVRARKSRSAREKSSGWSRCWRSCTVTAVGISSGGQRDRQRVVDGVERAEAPPQPPWPRGGERHRERPLRDAAREPVLGHRHLGQPFAGSGRSGRREGRVVERPDLGEPAAEPARGRLGSADLAGHERQQADPHAHRRSVSRPARYNPPMPDQSEENGELAGISSNGDVDVAALFEQLKQEVRRSGAAPGEAGDGDDRHAARAEAERLWPVSADRSLRLRPGVRGGIGTPAKAVLRKLMRWYVEPLAYDQRSFNAAALRLIDDLEERVAQLEAELKQRG